LEDLVEQKNELKQEIGLLSHCSKYPKVIDCQQLKEITIFAFNQLMLSILPRHKGLNGPSELLVTLTKLNVTFSN